MPRLLLAVILSVPFGVWVGELVVDGFFGKAMILAKICQMFVSCRELALFSVARAFLGVGCGVVFQRRV
jgi:glucose-6-phosphate-specific signal transduction histidine kinase